MTDMNRDIAEKLGWVRVREIRRSHPPMCYWKLPDDTVIKDYLQADFTHSLDACVKYIVPWLEERDMTIQMWRMDKQSWDVVITNTEDIDAHEIEESPSIALCKAFLEV